MARAILTLKARLRCGHLTSRVWLRARRRFVKIGGDPALSGGDPGGRLIFGCFLAAQGTPCRRTQKMERGHAPFIQLDGKAICTDAVVGKTNGPSGAVPYFARGRRQRWVRTWP